AAVCSATRMWPFFRRARSLAGIVGPTRIDLVATIVCDDVLTSPFSGVQAAAFVVQLVASTDLPSMEHRSLVISTAGQFSQGERRTERIVLGESVLAHADTGGRIHAGTASVRIVYPAATSEGHIRALPPDVAPQLARGESTHGFDYHETALRVGDRVRVRGVV